MKTQIFTLILVILSFNGFTQWIVRQTPVSTNLYCLSFIDQTAGMVAGEQGTLLKTADGGLSWQTYNVATEDFRAVCMVNYDLHFVGGTNLYRSANGGYTWEVISDIFNPSSIIFTDELNGKLTCPAGVYETNDAGLTWSQVINGSTSVYETTTSFESTTIALGNVGGFASYSCIGMRSLGNVYYPFEVWSFPNSNAYTSAYASTPDTVYLCFNQFSNWVPGDFNQFLRLTNFSIQPNYFQDSTWTFTTEIITDFVPDLMNSVYMVNDNFGYGCGQSGTIFRTNDGGITWIPDYDGTTPLSKMQFIDDDNAYAVGEAGLVLRHTYITDINSLDLNIRFSVYPNPTAESMTISTGDKAKFVEMINIDGKLIFSSRLNGSKEFNLDLQGVNSGLYMLRLTMADGSMQTSKVMVKK